MVAESSFITETTLIQTPLPAFCYSGSHSGCHVFLCGFLAVDELFFYPHDGGDTASFNFCDTSD